VSLLMVRWTRSLVSLVFVAFAVTVLAVGLGARLGPAIGYEVYSIRSGSMTPAMPIGALALVSRQAELAGPGQALAYRLPSGVVVTHREVEVIDRDGAAYLRTKGDANGEADPTLVSAAAVIGPVQVSIPLLGFLLAMLGMPIGLVSIVASAATLIACIWLLEDLEETLSPAVRSVLAVRSEAQEAEAAHSQAAPRAY
jgi:signal peptidase